MNPSMLIQLCNKDGTSHSLVPFPTALEDLTVEELALVRRLLLKTFRKRLMTNPETLHAPCTGQGCKICIKPEHQKIIDGLIRKGYDLELTV